MTTIPTLYVTQPLHRLFRERPDAVATVSGERTRTWRDVTLRVRRFADLLQSLGVMVGDRVGMLAPNSDLFVDVLFGACWAGAVAAPLNTRWSVAEISYALVDSNVEVLVIDPAFLPMLADIRKAAPCVRHVISPTDARHGCIDLEAALKHAGEADDRLRHGDDLALILYTGGTTGRPKGVMLSHRALMTYGMCLAGSGESAPTACMLHTAPLFHVGAIAGFLASLLNGARHIFLSSFAPGATIDAIARHDVTDVFLVPTMLQAVLGHPDFTPDDLSSVRRIFYGGAPIAAVLVDRARAAMPKAGFVQGYGMTETAGAVSLLAPSDHHHAERLRSVGRAVMAVEIRIVDAGGDEVTAGIPGEIVVRGATVMAGYWNRMEETAEALRSGWLHTGDVGWMDVDGYLYVVDRLKDMIVTGGENVYSSEVEGALAGHDAVAQCAVVGCPDERWGETIHAVVVLRDGADATEADLLAHCRTLIAGYKCPRSFSIVDTLPLSPVGKVLKAELRRQYGYGKNGSEALASNRVARSDAA